MITKLTMRRRPLLSPRRSAVLLAATVALTACSHGPKETFGTRRPIAQGSGSGSGSHSGTSASALPKDGAYFANPALVDDVLKAAQNAAVTIGSYDYRNLTASLDAGVQLATPRFATKYRQTMATLTKNAPKTQTIQTTTILKGGVGRFSKDLSSANVFLVVRQVIADAATQAGQPQTAVANAAVTMKHVGTRWLVDDVQAGGSTGVPPGTADLANAEKAGRTVVQNILSYRRSHFTADYDRALAGATGQLTDDLKRQRAKTLKTMTAKKFDLRGKLIGDAIEIANGTTVVLLIAGNEYEVDDNGKQTLATSVRFELTLTKVAGKWLASDAATDAVN